MESKRITLGGTDAAPTATIATAVMADIVTTLFSTTEVITGMYGLAQKVLLGVGGAVIQSVRTGGGVNIFKSGA